MKVRIEEIIQAINDIDKEFLYASHYILEHLKRRLFKKAVKDVQKEK